MKLAIVGSRDYPGPVEVAEFVLGLPAGTVVVSGGAHGPDAWAANIAHYVADHLPKPEVIWADWAGLGKTAGARRNTDVVRRCHRLVAFWDGRSKGTLDAIMKAHKASKLDLVQMAKGNGWSRGDWWLPW